MIRMMPIASLVAAAVLTAACDVPKNEEQPAEEPKLGQPMAPGSSFTDPPPLEPPVTQSETPERQP